MHSLLGTGSMPVGLQLETDRLILRPPRIEDFEPWVEFAADPETTRFLGGPQPRAVVWRNFLTLVGAWQIQGFAMFSVLEKASGRWMGRIGPWKPEGWPGTEVGWSLAREFWGQGYALEAAILTQELDEALTDTLHDSLDRPLHDSLYIEGFRALGRADDRQRQLDLIGEVGHHVDRYVRGRMLQATFRMVRRPVHAAGFGNLYDFLDRGFAAMRDLDSAGRLLNELTRAEAAIMARLYAGHPTPYAGQ